MQYRSGFSLVELSIVLVILGLLVGGILAGKSLIQASKLRKHITYITEFKASWHTFRDKYFYIPGDMPNATEFWGRSSLAGDACLTDPGVASATGACNGNGNGKIEWGVLRENSQVWYHLKLAGLVNAQDIVPHFSYNTSTYKIPPASWLGGMLIGSGDVLAELYSHASDAALGANYTGNAIQFAQRNATANAYIEAYMIPEDTWNIDSKMDDGMLQRGNFRASNGYVNGTTTAVRAACASGVNPNYTYNLANTELACKFSAKLD